MRINIFSKETWSCIL